MRYKYDSVMDKIKSMLPCQKGDIYYTIEKVSKIDREIKEDHGGTPVVMEYSTVIGKRITEHHWGETHDIIREIEHKSIGKRIFLSKEEAENKMETYWENWWGDNPKDKK